MGSSLTGNSYYKVGFKYVNIMPPSYSYFSKNNIYKRINRLQCQKHKLSRLLDNFDNSKTEIENMLANNYYQVYDCGTIKVKYIRN